MRVWFITPLLAVVVSASYLTLAIFDTGEAEHLAPAYALVTVLLAVGNLGREWHDRRSP